MSITDAEFSSLLKRLSELERRLGSAQEQIDQGAVGLSSVSHDSLLSGNGTGISPLSASPLSGTINARFVDLSGSISGKFVALSAEIDSDVSSLSGTVNARFANFSGSSADFPFISLADYTSPDTGANVRLQVERAINAAIDQRMPLFVPPGTYLIARSGSSSWCLKPTGSFTMFGVPDKSVIKAIPDSVMSPLLGIYLTDVNNVVIRDIVYDGSWNNPTTTVYTTASLPSTHIKVVSTDDFPSSGTIFIQNTDGVAQKITYTGKLQGPTSGVFTGCSGGTGQLAIGSRFGSMNSVYGLDHRTYAVYVGSVASGSNGQDVGSLVANELYVAHMSANLPGIQFNATAGTLAIRTSNGWQKVSFAGKNTGSLKFTGVTPYDNATGSISTGDPMYYAADPKSHGIAMTSNVQNVLVEGVRFKHVYGDGIRISSGLLFPSARNITIRKCQINGVCARNGITISMHAENVLIDNCDIDNVFTTAIDCEPELDGAWVRAIWVRSTTMGSLANRGTWFMDHGSNSENVFSIGGSSSTHPQPNNYIQHIRVDNCKIFGSTTITDGVDVVMRGNTIYNLNGTAWPAIYTTIYANDIWVDQNWIYDMTVAPTGNFVNGAGAITAMRYATSPLRMRITNNSIYARNGKAGIHIEGTGGNTGVTGSASEVYESVFIAGVSDIPGYLVDPSASWIDDQHNGLEITMGGRMNTVVDTIASTKRLQFGAQSNWTDAFGNEVPAPAAGSYTVHTAGGVVDVQDNAIDCRNNDNNGAGAVGIRLTSPQMPNCRFRIKNNTIRGATGAGIYVGAPSVPANAFKLTEITDNHIWDDQQVVTCTKGIEYSGVSNLGRWIMRGNVCESSIATALFGVSSGAWLEEDGPIQRWAGYGSPEGVVSAPVGSWYRQSNGGAGTSYYVKESGTSTTGWSSIGGTVSATIPPWVQMLNLTGGTFDPTALSTNTALTTGTVLLYKARVYATSFDKVVFQVATAIVGGTNVYLGIYKSDGTQTAAMATATVDIIASVGTTGVKTITLNNPITTSIGDDVYVGFLQVGAPGTPLGLRTTAQNTATNGNITAAQGYRSGGSGAGLSALPSSITLASMATAGAMAWIGIQ